MSSWVLIHDAARPLRRPPCSSASSRPRSARAPPSRRLPCADTVKGSEASWVTATLDRSALRLVQTPQVFRTPALLEAYAKARRSARDQSPTTPPSTRRSAIPSPGSRARPDNTKITEAGGPRRRRSQARAPAFRASALATTFIPSPTAESSSWAAWRFPGDGLSGDSDADIVAHAVTDAVLGAAALGDLGAPLSPDTDARFQGRRQPGAPRAPPSPSAPRARPTRRERRPDRRRDAARRSRPQRCRCAEKLAEALGVPVERVNVKATTGEGLGFVGREEGIAVQAVAMLWTT